MRIEVVMIVVLPACTSNTDLRTCVCICCYARQASAAATWRETVAASRESLASMAAAAQQQQQQPDGGQAVCDAADHATTATYLYQVQPARVY